MADPIKGSIEVVTGNESTGVNGVAWVVSDVPVVLRNLYGIKGMQAETPKKQPTGRTPRYQWSGVDGNNQAVTLMLWESG